MSKEETLKILKALPKEEQVQLAKDLDEMTHMGGAPWRI